MTFKLNKSIIATIAIAFLAGTVITSSLNSAYGIGDPYTAIVTALNDIKNAITGIHPTVNVSPTPITINAPAGPPGAAGPPGPKGDKGDPGPPGTISIDCTNLNPGAILVDCTLSIMDLHGKNLRGANLFSADLGDSNLTGADLSGAELTTALFDQANLSGANLSYAKLTNADFNLANLSGADLSHADISGATFVGAHANPACFGNPICSTLPLS